MDKLTAPYQKFAGDFLGYCDKENIRRRNGVVVFAHDFTATTDCSLTVIKLGKLKEVLRQYGGAQLYGLSSVHQSKTQWKGVKSFVLKGRAKAKMQDDAKTQPNKASATIVPVDTGHSQFLPIQSV